MASDEQFNKKSFTTGHTGFGIPFATWPDRSDVPRSAARPLRYMDRYLTVNQGSVFYMTELLAQVEGLERGPAGNTALAAAFVLAQEMDEDQILVVQETEYTGAGKHINPQLTFAKENGIKILKGDPSQEVPGENIILPEKPGKRCVEEKKKKKTKKSYIRNCIKNTEVDSVNREDLDFLVADTKSNESFVRETLEELGVKVETEER